MSPATTGPGIGPVTTSARAYWLTQGVSWGAVAASQIVMMTLAGGFSWPSALANAGACALGLLLSHGLRHLIRRRGWHRLGAAAFFVRAAIAALGSGALLIAILAVIVVLANRSLAVEALGGEVESLTEPARLLVLSVYWGAILLAWELLYYGYQLLQRLRRAEVDRWRLEAAVREAELRALEAQLDPHFMFNALNSIRALISESPERARDAVTQLAGILRYSLGAGRAELVPLEQELETVRRYLALETTRFEDRLSCTFEVEPAARTVAVPPMVLQHLVENGIKHGVGRHPGSGWLSVSARCATDALVVEVINSGSWEEPDESVAGRGLDQARQRLRLLYGDRASLTLAPVGGDRVRARLELPRRNAA